MFSFGSGSNLDREGSNVQFWFGFGLKQRSTKCSVSNWLFEAGQTRTKCSALVWLQTLVEKN